MPTVNDQAFIPARSTDVTPKHCAAESSTSFHVRSLAAIPSRPCLNGTLTKGSATTGNPDRLVMVPAHWIDACTRKATREDWRISLALARYSGLRSHETRIQKWEEIDLPKNVTMLRSQKSRPSADAESSRYSRNRIARSVARHRLDKLAGQFA